MLGMKPRSVKDWEVKAQENVHRQHEIADEFLRVLNELQRVRDRWRSLEGDRKEILGLLPALRREHKLDADEIARLEGLAEVESVVDRMIVVRCGIPQAVIGAVDKVVGARAAYQKKIEFVEQEKKNPPKWSNPDAQRFTVDADVDPSQVRFRPLSVYPPQGLRSTPPGGWFGPMPGA